LGRVNRNQPPPTPLFSNVTYECQSCGRTYLKFDTVGLLIILPIAIMGVGTILSYVGVLDSEWTEFAGEPLWWKYLCSGGLIICAIVYFALVPKELIKRLIGDNKR